MIVKGYNEIASLYNEKRIAKKELNYKYFEALSEYLPKGGSLLDLGCGAAIPATSFFVEKGFDAIGVDLSEEMIKLAKSNIPQGNFFVNDICDCQFPDSSFDLIISTYALVHIPQEKQKTLFTQLHKWLKPKGRAFFNLGTENKKSLIKDDWYGVKMYWSHYDPEAYKSIFANLGFNIVWEEMEFLPNGESFFNVIIEKERK